MKALDFATCWLVVTVEAEGRTPVPAINDALALWRQPMRTTTCDENALHAFALHGKHAACFAHWRTIALSKDQTVLCRVTLCVCVERSPSNSLMPVTDDRLRALAGLPAQQANVVLRAGDDVVSSWRPGCFSVHQFSSELLQSFEWLVLFS